MNRHRINLRRYARRLCLSLSAGLCLALTSAGYAQWPTDYLQPNILGGGTDVRAGSVMATQAGGALVAFDGYTTAVRQVTARHFNGAGDQLFTEINLYPNTQLAINLYLAQPTSSAGSCVLYSYLAQPDLDSGAPTVISQSIDNTGNWISAGFSYELLMQGLIYTKDHKLARVYTKPWAGEIASGVGVSSWTNPMPTGEQFVDFSLVSTQPGRLLYSYTRRGPQPGAPGEVWTSGGYSVPPDEFPFPSIPANEGTGQDQSHSQLTELSSQNMTLTWLQTQDGITSLYVKPVNFNGNELSASRKALDNIVEYQATSTTLGMPAFAAVQREETADAPTDTLIGGLVNPSNGGTLTIPIAAGPDVKVKDVRQMANGDFRLSYSTLEGGTTLLKVRGISGLSGATLWETTVADLGRASDEIVETYPNTFMDSNAQSVLYILARYDQPGTANSLFQMVRLRADGAMGAD